VNPKRAPKRRAPQRRVQQQVSYQPIIMTNASVPAPAPMPIQTSSGFTPIAPPPTSLGTPMELRAPVEVPVFAKETPKVIGDEQVSIPVPKPVSAPESIIVPIKPVIPDDRPIVMPRPVPPPPTSIISTKPPLTIDKSESKSISSLFSDISKDTGITSQKVANFLFKKKKEEPKAPPPSVASSSDMSVPTSIPTSTTKADYLFLDDRSIPEDQSISSMSGFNPPSEKSSIKKKPIIAEPKEVVVLKKPELKRSDPYNIFSDNESIARATPVADDVASDVATQGTFKPKPPKKRPVLSESEVSDTGANIIPQDVAGRRMPPIKEKKSNYQSLGDLQAVAKSSGLEIKRPTGKNKTRNELLLEIYGK